MKKSKAINLVLISAALASCHKEKPKENKPNLYVRGDTTAPYARRHYGGPSMLWYYAFRPYGFYNSIGNSFQHTGYYNNSINEMANLGKNTSKSFATRGGFGYPSNNYSVSS